MGGVGDRADVLRVESGKGDGSSCRVYAFCKSWFRKRGWDMMGQKELGKWKNQQHES